MALRSPVVLSDMGSLSRRKLTAKLFGQQPDKPKTQVFKLVILLQINEYVGIKNSWFLSNDFAKPSRAR